MSYTTFFYDEQIRRFLLQFIRILSNFQVRLGNNDQGQHTYQRVPVFYGDASRQASQILRSNSENAIKAVPAMAVHINQLTYDRERVQEPNFVSKLNIRTRLYDEATGQYTEEQGGAYTVERLMPVPYKLTLKVDVWTSNTEQKLMLLEQIMLLFNPALEIQSTDNYIDWTSLSYVLLTDIEWSNRAVPSGTEETIDIASLTFELPIWISAPAKVKQLGVIQKVVNSIYDTQGQLKDDLFSDNASQLLTQKTLTFGNYGVVFQGNTLKLVKESDIKDDDAKISMEVNLRQQHVWAAILSEYGTVRNGLSIIRLMQPNGSELVGTIALHPADNTLLLYTVFNDTMPSNTLPPINAIINPQSVSVDDAHLLAPVKGTRYLLLHGIGHRGDTEYATAWNPEDKLPLVAHAHDIIEFNGDFWSVVFDNRRTNTLEYVTNLTTNIQYKWENHMWAKSVEGHYDALKWSIVL
jgi:hypothetical protein